MFESLSDRFDGIFTRLKGRGRLDEKDVEAVVAELRTALLEADVHVEVVKTFLDRVRERAIGADLTKVLSPGQQVIKIVHEELVEILGGTTGKLAMSARPPTVVMLVGLQGAGKTTAIAKLARLLKTQGQSVLLVAADLQRPAAVEQLRVLGERIDVPVFSASGSSAASRTTDVPTALSDPVAVVQGARAEARRLGKGVVLVDTAGRLQIDADLMGQLVEMRDAVQPHQVLLVLDAMTGQEAVPVAEAFRSAVGLDGMILTKIDGDARGGAALSVKQITGKPILYVGTGEKLDEFEVFHPDRMASRILGMGDVLTLIEKAEETFEAEAAAKVEKKLREGQFTLDDFLEQMRQVRQMGSLQSILGMMPGISKEIKNAKIDDRELGRVEAIICSMTMAERESPDLINGSRRVRISRGSGTSTQEVNSLLKQFKMMQKMMRQAMGGAGRGLGRGDFDLAALTGGAQAAAGPSGRPGARPTGKAKSGSKGSGGRKGRKGR